MIFFGSSFDDFLANLQFMLPRCEKTSLVMNWGMFHFMVKDGIMLGHKVSKVEIEVGLAKINTISKLRPLTNMKRVHSFLCHVGFYH